MIFLEDKHKKIIKEILSKYPYKFYVFGSRVKENHKKLSDLDLCYLDPIPSSVINLIENDFEESDLPFKVDIINWKNCSKEFQEEINKDLILFV